MPSNYVLFHVRNGKPCPDGFAAAYCAWTALQDSATYLPVCYGDGVKFNQLEEICEQSITVVIRDKDNKPKDFHLDNGANIYIVDFSYERKIITEMMKHANSVVVLDHHKTAERELLGISGAIFDMARSGAQIAWDYWYPGTERPALIDYVADRDLWHHDLPDSRVVNYGLRAVDNDFEYWHALAKLPREEFIRTMKNIGQLPLNRYDAIVSDIALRATPMLWDVEWRTYLVMLVETDNYAYVSDACNKAIALHLAKDPDMAMNIRKKDGIATVSLRSNYKIDVGAIAKQFEGGGGHRNAAGFRVAESELPKLINLRPQ